MDGNRFDELSRNVAAGISRRSAVKGAAAGLLGALGLRKAADAQVTQAQCSNKACKNNSAVCTNGCVCCVYGNGNSRCRPPGQCAPGTEVGGTTTTTAAPTTTTTTPPPCPQGYEFLNGGCFQIVAGLNMSLCVNDCQVFGSVDGSGNYLCGNITGFGFVCSTTPNCPTGFACFSGGSFCISVC